MFGKILPFFVLCSLMAATLVHAEGGSGDDTNPLLATPGSAMSRPAVRHRKPVPRPVLPGAPIPYTAYSAGKAPAASPVIAAALTPGASVAHPAAPLPPPIEIAPVPQPALPVQPVTAPPPPAPTPQTAPPIAEISLKCETRVSDGKRQMSQGSFFIDLFPSPVFPDQQADFKFLFVDPAHKSLIRETVCLDTACSATVSGTAYYLVNRRTRHGEALRITLDRSNGAFYAEAIDRSMTGGAHLGEQGWCTPQKLPSALF